MSRPAAAAPREFTLKMWSNGFSIDDGELREYNDPRHGLHFCPLLKQDFLVCRLLKRALHLSDLFVVSIETAPSSPQ